MRHTISSEERHATIAKTRGDGNREIMIAFFHDGTTGGFIDAVHKKEEKMEKYRCNTEYIDMLKRLSYEIEKYEEIMGQQAEAKALRTGSESKLVKEMPENRNEYGLFFVENYYD